MKLGFSFWGVCYDFELHRHSKLDTPDGHRYGRPIFVRELLQRNHDVVMMQDRREEFGTYRIDDARMVDYCTDRDRDRFPDLDVLFLEWRWSTRKNDVRHPDHDPLMYEPDLDRQLELIEYYKDRCPIIAWDTDLKVTPEDEERWPEIIWTDPSFKTNEQRAKRVSLPFWTDWKEIFPVAKPYPVMGLVGNNYERAPEFKKFYFEPAAMMRGSGIQVSMYGNWLQSSPEREAPEKLIAQNSCVAFNHRMNFYDSMAILNRFITTIHVSKPRYYQTGFISPRYLETLAVNCPALVPKDQLLSHVLGEDFIVDSQASIIDRVYKFQKLTLDQRREVVAEQRMNMQRAGHFDVKHIVDFIESCVT